MAKPEQSADIFLDRIRRATHTQSYTDSSTSTSQRGIQTQSIVDILNESLEYLHSIIYDNGSQTYIKQSLLNTVANTESVTLPTDSFLDVNILSVEYKYGSGSNDYVKIDKMSEHERDTSRTGEPHNYIHRNNTILLYPRPSTSTTSGLRVTYEYQLPTVDVRRGKVSAVDNGTAPTTITITDNALGTIALADTDLVGMYITVVDKDGTQQMKNIPVSSYDSGTGVITLGSFTPDSGEEVSTNDYVVIGANASSHSPFPRATEPFIIEYVKREIFERLGDLTRLQSSTRKLDILQFRMESMYASTSSDINHISEIDPERFI